MKPQSQVCPLAARPQRLFLPSVRALWAQLGCIFNSVRLECPAATYLPRQRDIPAKGIDKREGMGTGMAYLFSCRTANAIVYSKIRSKLGSTVLWYSNHEVWVAQRCTSG